MVLLSHEWRSTLLNRSLFSHDLSQKCVIIVKLVGKSEDTFNNCTLKAAMHYAMPGAPALIIPPVCASA